MKTELKNKMKKSNSLMCSMLIGVFALFFTMQVTAQEKSEVKLNLPDGVYQFQKGCDFIAKGNKLYLIPDAIEKFGIAKLNQWFAGQKYKVIFRGEKVGEGYYGKIPENWSNFTSYANPFPADESKPNNYQEEMVIKGPLYSKESSAMIEGNANQVITVPNAYKAIPQKRDYSISEDEVRAVEKLAKQQLLSQLKRTKQFAKVKLSSEDLNSTELVSLDKVTHKSKDMHIGILRQTKGPLSFFNILFAVKDESVKLITVARVEVIAISGVLDVEGHGSNALIIYKTDSGAEENTIWLEIFKQQSDGSWVQIWQRKKQS